MTGLYIRAFSDVINKKPGDPVSHNVLQIYLHGLSHGAHFSYKY